MLASVPGLTAVGMPPSPAALLALAAPSLAHLSWLDIAIIAIYFVMVIWIGFYLKGQANTSEEFFMAGREMTAWIAGLSFVSANLGSLELMGWAGSAYQYGILAAHWYWIGAIPAMLFLGIVMMPFYYVCKTHSVPGYLKLRYGQGASIVSAFSFAFMTVLMSGVNMFAMAEVMKVVLGWDLNFSIIVSSLAVAAYVALGGLRSAIFNEVLQFMLIWGGALLVPILGLVEAGGWNGFKAKLAHNISGWRNRSRRLHAYVAQHGPLHGQSRWASTGPASSSVWASPSASATGRPTSSSCSAFSRHITCVPRAWLRSSARSSRWPCRSSSFFPACSGLLCCRMEMAA